MQAVRSDVLVVSRRPTFLEIAAGFLLLGTVVLHVVAMFFTYYTGSKGNGGGSIWVHPDQVTLYVFLAGGWAIALAVGLIGPHRLSIAAGLSVGLAVTELGSRALDVGSAIQQGTSSVGAGLWLMTAAWGVGAVGAILTVAAASVGRTRASRDSVGESPDAAVPGPVGGDYLGEPMVAALPPAPSSVVAWPPPDSGAVAWSRPLASSPTQVLPISPGARYQRNGVTVVVAVLALATAGAFLPAWDRYGGVAVNIGRTIGFTAGNAFDVPWKMMIGNILLAAALVVVPIVAVRLRNRAAGAALVGGSLLALAAQLASAVVQVDQPVNVSAVTGLPPAQISQDGLYLGVRLTGWYTLDALAALVLFAVVLIWATSRVVYESSPGIVPSAPLVWSEAMPGRS